MSGIEGVRKSSKKIPDANILMLTVIEDNNADFDALCSGACGYPCKENSSGHKLLEAIREASEGGSPMSSTIARKVVAAFQQIKPHLINTQSTLSERE